MTFKYCHLLPAPLPPLHSENCNFKHHSLQGDYSCIYSVSWAEILQQPDRKRFQVSGSATAPHFQESSIFWVCDGSWMLTKTWNRLRISFLYMAFTNCNEFILSLWHIIVRGLLIYRSLFDYTFRWQQPVELFLCPGADPKPHVICSVQIWIWINQSPAWMRLRVNEKQCALSHRGCASSRWLGYEFPSFLLVSGRELPASSHNPSPQPSKCDRSGTEKLPPGLLSSFDD